MGWTVKHGELTEKIIAGFYQVYNTLGWGFLERVYQLSLLHELEKRGMHVEPWGKVNVYYDGRLVGKYIADLLVEDSVILELKAVEALSAAHEAQLVNYLKATTIEVGLLLNFGPRPQVKRKVFDAVHKPGLMRPAPTVDGEEPS